MYLAIAVLVYQLSSINRVGISHVNFVPDLLYLVKTIPFPEDFYEPFKSVLPLIMRDSEKVDLHSATLETHRDRSEGQTVENRPQDRVFYVLDV